jgi:hypothetical protein
MQSWFKRTDSCWKRLAAVQAGAEHNLLSSELDLPASPAQNFPPSKVQTQPRV